VIEGSHDIEAVQALATLASKETSAAAGSAAALCGAVAAAVVLKASASSDRSGEAAQAAALRDRLMRLAGTDAAALATARAALASARGEAEPSEQRDFRLGTAVRRASEAPRRIAEACADIAVLAHGESQQVADDLRPDAVAAAHLAAGAAEAAAHLVTVNLVLREGDEEIVRALAAARAAADLVGLLRAT
jgi:formiminotetrahydrofolate cyclodeaminase